MICMTRKLSEEERRIWEQITSGITPLMNSSVLPSEGPVGPKVIARYPSAYDPRLDLHGMKIQEAYHAVMNHLDQGYREGFKKITVISGRSGQINQEIVRWLENNSHVRSINSLRGGGAWEICLKKRDT